MTYPVTHSPRVAACYLALAAHDRRWNNIVNDPMSLYAPLDDFAADHARSEIKLAARLLATARADRDEPAEQVALELLESYMP